MKNKAKLFGIYLPIYLILLIGTVVLRTVACMKYQVDFGYFSDKLLINIAAISLAASVLFFLTFTFLERKNVKLVPTFDTPASYVPSALVAIAHVFFSLHILRTSIAITSPSQMILKIFTAVLGILALLSAVYFALNTVFVRRISIKRSNFALVALIFLCCYVGYVYTDTSIPLNSTNKITDQMAYIAISVFFLYETRLSLGREKWRPYIAFGFIASLLTAFSAIPALIIYFVKGEVISTSIYETLLTFTFFIYITSRLFLTGKLIKDEESPVVTGIILSSDRRTDELTPKPEPTPEQDIEEALEDENQISFTELEEETTLDDTESINTEDEETVS